MHDKENEKRVVKYQQTAYSRQLSAAARRFLWATRIGRADCFM
jgi:hypothetical protein